MSRPLLSIMIPTVKEREALYLRLIQNLWAQTRNVASGTIEIERMIDNKEMTIGEKRNQLYKMARGVYVIQVDDDDLLDENFFSRVLPHCEKGAFDCITYQELVSIDGIERTCNHSIKYGGWDENEDGYDYVRTPFMKDVILTEIAQSVPVPHMRFGEDHEWSKAIQPLLKTEAHIDEKLYHYLHNSSPHAERYGLNK